MINVFAGKNEKTHKSVADNEREKASETKVSGEERSNTVLNEQNLQDQVEEQQENRSKDKMQGTKDTCTNFELVMDENTEKLESVKANVGKTMLEWKGDEGKGSGAVKRRFENEETNDGNNDDEGRTQIKSRKIIESTNEKDNMANQTNDESAQTTRMENAENNKIISAEDKSIVSKLFVHSQWLSVQSSYFKALFYSGLKETYSKEVVMKIHQREHEAHLALIEAMYKLDVLNDKDYKLIVQVLILANKYDIPLLVKKCKYLLLSTAPNLEMCEYILKETQHLSEMEIVYEILEEFLVKQFTPIDKTWTMDKFTDLSVPALRLLLGSDHLPTKSENTIFVALMKWVSVNIGFPACEGFDLLNVLRFEFMSVDFLYDVVQHHHIAKRMPGFDKYLLNGLAYHGFSNLRREKLEPRPKKRPLVKDSDPTFSWVIDDELEKKLTASPGKPFYSDTFWHQGYRMQLSLEYRNESKCGFYVTVCDLKDKASLHVGFKAQSNLFVSKTEQMEKTEYTSETSGWGYETIKRNPILRGEGYTIDIWVTVY